MSRCLPFLLFLIVLRATLMASPVENGGVGICRLSPDRAESFFRRAAELVADQGKRPQRLWVNGVELSMEAAKGGRFLLCCGQCQNLDMVDDFSAPLPAFDLLRFDMDLPFLLWKEAVYDGPGEFLGRPVQRFLIQAPQPYPLSHVYVWIDGRFGLPLGWDAFDREGRLWRQFRVRSFRRRNGDWTVGRMQIRCLDTGRSISLEHP